MDSQLVKRAQDGDERAFEALVVASHALLFRAAHGILRDADGAEDATQHALLEAWRSLSRLRDRSSFLPWSMGFLVEACRRTEADDAASLDTDEQSADFTEVTSADPFGTVLDRDQLSRAFRQLAFDDRSVLVLRFLADLEPEQAGVALDLRSTAVEARTEAALEALGTAIDGDPASVVKLTPQPEGA